jgi:hypothetical protein
MVTIHVEDPPQGEGLRPNVEYGRPLPASLPPSRQTRRVYRLRPPTFLHELRQHVPSQSELQQRWLTPKQSARTFLELQSSTPLHSSILHPQIPSPAHKKWILHKNTSTLPMPAKPLLPSSSHHHPKPEPLLPLPVGPPLPSLTGTKRRPSPPTTETRRSWWRRTLYRHP